MQPQAIPNVERLLTTEEVADYLRVPASWVRDHSNGKRQPALPSIKIGHYRRFRLDELQHWLREHTDAAL